MACEDVYCLGVNYELRREGGKQTAKEYRREATSRGRYEGRAACSIRCRKNTGGGPPRGRGSLLNARPKKRGGAARATIGKRRRIKHAIPRNEPILFSINCLCIALIHRSEEHTSELQSPM